MVDENGHDENVTSDINLFESSFKGFRVYIRFLHSFLIELSSNNQICYINIAENLI